MLLTYSSLISASDTGASRIQQLVDWCGPDFDGLIVFDGAVPLTPTLSSPLDVDLKSSAGTQRECEGVPLLLLCLQPKEAQPPKEMQMSGLLS